MDLKDTVTLCLHLKDEALQVRFGREFHRSIFPIHRM